MRPQKYRYIVWVGAFTSTILFVLLLLPGLAFAATINMSVSSTSLNFGNVTVGQPSDQVITITNQASSTATLGVSMTISSSCSCFFVAGAAFGLPPGNARSVTVRFLPTSLGTFSGTLTIAHNATNQSSPTNVALSGTGVPAINLSLNPSSVSFGNIPVGLLSNQTLTVTNLPNSTNTLEGTIGNLSSPFSILSGGGAFSLAPGQSRRVVINFSPTSAGAFSQTLSITHNATNQSSPTDVSVSGAGILPVINMSVSPNPLDFSNVAVDQSSTQAITILNLATSTGILEGSVPNLSGIFSVVSGGGAFSLAPGQLRRVLISFSPPSLGAFSDTLSITHNATNQSSPTDVTLHGTGTPPVVNMDIGPNPVNFSNVTVGQSTTQTLLITNLATSVGTLEGEVGNLSGPFSIVSGGGSFSLLPRQSRAVVIRFSPTSLGTFSDTLFITHNATNQSNPAQVSLVGVGALTVNLTLSSQSLGFGNVPVGQSVRQTLTITNEATSSGPLTGSIGLPSSPFSLTSGGGEFNLAPGRSLSVVVNFSSTVPGLFVGTLSITHNATNQSNPINIMLSGATPVNWGVRNDIPVPGDYDGDRKADIAVWRPSDGNWFIVPSTTQTPLVQPWGVLGDEPVPADYDGDGLTDLAVWRPSLGTWFIQNSLTGPRIENFGQILDTPVPGDYDGDGKLELGVWRGSEGNWIIPFANGDLRITPWGLPGDIPLAKDYDGDGKADLGIWRPSEGVWYLGFANGQFSITQWGLLNDIPAPADFDGDGKADLAVWRPSEGNWYILFSSGGFSVTQWGRPGDTPVPADYNGDGKADLAVWRPSEGNWYVFFK